MAPVLNVQGADFDLLDVSQAISTATEITNHVF